MLIALFSLHGLIRSINPELGRDADTGGQITYVLDFAKELSKQPNFKQIILFTRLIDEPNKVSSDYRQPEEIINDKFKIVRLAFGPKRYLRKEALWPYLDACVDSALQYFRRFGLPSFLHGHYADAGFVCSRLSALLGVPMLFTGHSLGYDKKRRLLSKGQSLESIEEKYRISKRIEAEEISLASASVTIASSCQEREVQYSQYLNHHPENIRVIEPGIDLSRFSHELRALPDLSIFSKINKFLDNKSKPPILALARPVPKKNLTALVHAYGQNHELQEIANLIICAGNRDDIAEMDKEQRDVLNELLLLVDKYDLWGKVALPKTHNSSEVPDLYSWTKELGGVFVNPALTEPFGLTILEAAASGVPVVATQDGGPSVILNKLKNGICIDPLDHDAIGDAIYKIVSNPQLWNDYSKSGINLVESIYSWSSHVSRYINLLSEIDDGRDKYKINLKPSKQLFRAKDLIITGLDNTLTTSDPAEVSKFSKMIELNQGELGFGLATSHSWEDAKSILELHNLPEPVFYIARAGTEIFYPNDQEPDRKWRRHIDHRWEPLEIKKLLENLSWLELQEDKHQTYHKISYYLNAPDSQKRLKELRNSLWSSRLRCRLMFSYGGYLDIIPERASLGLALKHIWMKWSLDPMKILGIGVSSNEHGLVIGSNHGAVLKNHSGELKSLRRNKSIYFTKASGISGIFEALAHYDFAKDLPNLAAFLPSPEPAEVTVIAELDQKKMPHKRVIGA